MTIQFVEFSVCSSLRQLLIALSLYLCVTKVKSQCQARPGATRRISRGKQDWSIWLKALSKSMVKRHRLSSMSCFRNQRLVVWTMASQPCFVPNSSRVGRVMSSETLASWAFNYETSKSFTDDCWPVAVVLQGCERGTGDPRGKGAWHGALGHDADRGMETQHQLTSVTWKGGQLKCAVGGRQTLLLPSSDEGNHREEQALECWPSFFVKVVAWSSLC